MTFDFIFMLTSDDKTIPDARSRLDEVLQGGATHIGFKDVGLPFDELKLLAGEIRAAGCQLYLEVVSLDAEDAECFQCRDVLWANNFLGQCRLATALQAFFEALEPGRLGVQGVSPE